MKTKGIGITLLTLAAAMPYSVWAQEDTAPATTPAATAPSDGAGGNAVPTEAPAVKKADDKAKNKKIDRPKEEVDTSASPSPTAPIKSAEDMAQTTNRLKTLEGSTSPWSGQLNFTYSGSTINHPFSASAPNPGRETQPIIVNLQGTVAVLYRFNKKTTLGFGTGVYTETPFQGPSNTSVSDPYLDFGRTYSIPGMPLHNRMDASVNVWTNSQQHGQQGWIGGLSLSNESTYSTKFGLTFGLVLEFDTNLISNDAQYNTPGILPAQTLYDLQIDPYVEYKLNNTFNLRSVFGFMPAHTRALDGFWALSYPEWYETLGVGIQVAEPVFLYPFIKYYPFAHNLGVKTTFFGLNAIVNVF